MSAIRTEQNASDKFILRNGHSSQYLNTNSNLDSQLQNSNLDTLNTGTERKITFESSRMDSSKLKIEEVNELDSLEASIIERRKARSLQINKLKSNRKLMMRR